MIPIKGCYILRIGSYRRLVKGTLPTSVSYHIFVCNDQIAWKVFKILGNEANKVILELKESLFIGRDKPAPSSTAWKASKYGVISGPYFPVLGMNVDIYSLNIRIQSECKKIRTRKNSVFGHFSRSVGTSSLRMAFILFCHFEEFHLHHFCYICFFCEKTIWFFIRFMIIVLFLLW